MEDELDLSLRNTASIVPRLTHRPAAPGAAGGGGAAGGEFTFRLLDAFNYNPEPHNGHKMRVTGYMVRLGAEIRVNVMSLQMVGATCAN